MTTESWLYRDKRGRLILHVENDGAAFLRHGPEASEYIVTLDRDGELLIDGQRRLWAIPALDKAKQMLQFPGLIALEKQRHKR